jgi:hypothetical protein
MTFGTTLVLPYNFIIYPVKLVAGTFIVTVWSVMCDALNRVMFQSTSVQATLFDS